MATIASIVNGKISPRVSPRRTPRRTVVKKAENRNPVKKSFDKRKTKTILPSVQQTPVN